MIPTKEMIEAAIKAPKHQFERRGAIGHWLISRKPAGTAVEEFDGSLSEAMDRCDYLDAEAALTAALSPELLSKGQWRGMESAPRDGTEIVLLFEDGRRRIASWSPHSDLSYPMTWQDSYRSTIVRPWKEDEEPTHWIPLPPPPAQE